MFVTLVDNKWIKFTIILDDSKKVLILKKGNRDQKWKNYGKKIEIKETSWRMEKS